MATEAEAGRLNAPFFMPPRVLGNTGEEGEFVLPRQTSMDPARRLDDFNYHPDSLPFTCTSTLASESLVKRKWTSGDAELTYDEEGSPLFGARAPQVERAGRKTKRKRAPFTHSCGAAGIGGMCPSISSPRVSNLPD